MKIRHPMSLGHPKVDMRLDVGESHAPCLSCVDRVALLRARVNVAERQTHCRKTDDPCDYDLVRKSETRCVLLKRETMSVSGRRDST